MPASEDESEYNAGRRLAAIMFADMVGYTAMAQRNEALAVQLLEDYRNILRALFHKHNGREIDAIGDGFFVEFASALDAVNCSVEIQSSLKELNEGRPSERKILARIGIHLGDVIHKEKRVMGDAVNVASRIEPLAMPGGICISRQVYDHVHNKLAFQIVTLGKQQLKNVESPAEIFTIELPWEKPAFAEQSTILERAVQEAGSETQELSRGVSSGIETLDEILGSGYPNKSSILVSGPPGVGKEALGYWFIRNGLIEGDYCLFVTHRPVTDALRNMKAYGVATDKLPEFLASSGSPKRCDLNDPASITFEIKQAVQQNISRRIRILTDVLSPLLVLNPRETMYRFWSELLAELKNYDAVLMVLAEEEMHSHDVFVTMEQLFDGEIELRIYEQGLSLTPLLRIKKMLGLQPLHGYFKLSFMRNKMEILANVSK